MSKLEIGQQVNLLTVVSTEIKINKRRYVVCECYCGTRKLVLINSLTRKNPIKSCGCIIGFDYNLPKIGTKYNYLTLIEKPFRENNITYATFQCSYKGCVNIHTTILTHVVNNIVKTCGCLHSEVASKLCKERNKKYLEEDVTKDPIYQQWIDIKRDGKLVCKEWKDDFIAFRDFVLANGWFKGCCISSTDSTQEISPTNFMIETRSDFSKIKCFTEETQKKSRETRIELWGSLCPPNHGPNGKTEIEILEFCNQFGHNFNKHRIGRTEIDIYDESLKLGIEHCGLYWHNEQSPTPRNREYHYNKYKLCQKNEIRLITIFGDEWTFRNYQVKNFLDSILNNNKERVYGRKCRIEMIKSTVGKVFIEENHIQGGKTSKVYFGLFYKEELLGVLSLASHHRNSSNTTLDRLCFKYGIQVIGGASKLWNAAKEWCIERNISKVITWSDNRWSVGGVYYKMGFELDDELPPDYSYIHLNSCKERYPKQSMKKTKIGCPPSKTEKEYLTELKYARIWDCGKKRFVYTINDLH